MMRLKEPHCEIEYRPQAAKTLRQCLITSIEREFPRLGGEWVIGLFVDKLLELIEAYWVTRERLKPGQTVWQAVAVDERPGYHKPMTKTQLIPVVITLVNQDDIADLRNGAKPREVLKRAVVRAAHEAYTQQGVLTGVDLGLLFRHSDDYVDTLIREHESETGQTVPRRGTVHDLGRSVTHKAIICRKAFLEGKPTPVIARETFHSPQAVDRYILDFSRIYFATVQRGMSPEETAFATQQSLGLVQQYIGLIREFALDEQSVYNRVGMQLSMSDGNCQVPLIGGTAHKE